MKKLMTILFCLIVSTTVCMAEEVKPEVTVMVGNLTEAGTKRFDYNLTYVVGATKIEGIPVRIQLDNIQSQFGRVRRLWVNAGEFNLAKGDLEASFSPGVIVDDKGRYWVGGTLVGAYKPLGVTIIYKGAAGNKSDRHLVFTSIKLTDWLALRHSWYTQKGMTPDSYLGPAVTIGKHVWLWGGPSTNRPGAWTVEGSVTFKFNL